MTAPVFIFTPETITPGDAAQAAGVGDVLILSGPEARHAVSVRRLRAGERVDLVDGQGLRLRCEVLAAPPGSGPRDGLTVRLAERLEEPPPHLRLVLVQALAKGGRDEQAVETATEVGVEEVIAWQAERCVSVWKGARGLKGRERWGATARQAAKQARRARIPEIGGPLSTAELARWVGEVTAANGVVLVLHEEASRPLSRVAVPAAEGAAGGAGDRGRTLAVVVGPEGGISEAETAVLQSAGALAVRLGPHVMRTASAGPVALAVLAQRAGLWG